MKLSSIKIKLKNCIYTKAFEYLMTMRKSKGKEIRYSHLQMEDYLQPNQYIQTKEDQQLLFNLRNKMLKSEGLLIENQTKICICGNQQNIQHLYNCKVINQNDPEYEYSLIYNGNLKQKKFILDRMKENIKTEQNIKLEHV